jgi:hypothetical protein
VEAIEAGGNVRELDADHVNALVGSMAVRGLIVPVAVRPLDGDRFTLVAGGLPGRPLRPARRKDRPPDRRRPAADQHGGADPPWPQHGRATRTAARSRRAAAGHHR